MNKTNESYTIFHYGIGKFDFFITKSLRTLWYPRFFSFSSKYTKFELTINYLGVNLIFIWSR